MTALAASNSFAETSVRRDDAGRAAARGGAARSCPCTCSSVPAAESLSTTGCSCSADRHTRHTSPVVPLAPGLQTGVVTGQWPPWPPPPGPPLKPPGPPGPLGTNGPGPGPPLGIQFGPIGPGPGPPLGMRPGPPPWQLFQSQLLPQPGSQNCPGHQSAGMDPIGPGRASATLAAPRPASPRPVAHAVAAAIRLMFLIRTEYHWPPATQTRKPVDAPVQSVTRSSSTTCG